MQIPGLIVAGYAHRTRTRSVESRVVVHQGRKSDGSRVQEVRGESPRIADASGSVRIGIFVVLMVLELSTSRAKFISCDADSLQARLA